MYYIVSPYGVVIKMPAGQLLKALKPMKDGKAVRSGGQCYRKHGHPGDEKDV